MNNGKKFQTGNVMLLTVTHLLHDVYSSFLAPLRPLLIEKFGLSLCSPPCGIFFSAFPGY